jgi:hypothetical protein
MTKTLWSSTVAALLLLVPTVAVAQRLARANHVQNDGRGIPQSASTPANAQKRFPQPNWTVKYDSGSLGLKPSQWLKIAFGPRAGLAQIANPVASIPADQVVTVEFSAKTEKNSRLLQGPRSGCGYAHSLMPDISKNPKPEVAVAIALYPGPVSRFAERLKAKHLVRIVWNVAGEQESMVVKVSDCEYQSFLANIRWTVGARWQEIGHELK